MHIKMLPILLEETSGHKPKTHCQCNKGLHQAKKMEGFRLEVIYQTTFYHMKNWKKKTAKQTTYKYQDIVWSDTQDTMFFLTHPDVNIRK